MSRKLRSLLHLSLLFLVATVGLARPVSEGEVRNAVGRWLAQTPRPLKSGVVGEIAKVRAVADEDGSLLFRVVAFTGGGFAVLAPDDELEPIIAFSSGDADLLQDGHPLLEVLRIDLRGRMARLREAGSAPAAAAPVGHPKWSALRAGDSVALANLVRSSAQEPLAQAAPTTLDDPRVDPFVVSQWNQGTVGGQYCYNYYTPSHYVSGCVATAMAQVLRYYRYPTAAVGATPFTISVDGASQSATTRGGDGLGGAYNWALMPLAPTGTTPDAQRAMIGALVYDAGLSVRMGYSSSWSGADVTAPISAMKGLFQYAASNGTYVSGGIPAASLQSILHPNLDAGMPVLLGIRSAANDGHMVVCDGYGYNLGTLYRHLNLGWGGNSDAWYALPQIGTTYNFTIVDAAIYNTHPTLRGEILSGRVLDTLGRPLAGALVGNGTLTATTNARGIYALTAVPAGTHTLTATLSGYHFQPITGVTVVASADWAATGDQWARDFQDYQPVAPAITTLSQVFGAPGTVVTITGTGFTGSTAVLFNTTAATTFTVLSATSISATVPAGATTGHVSVTNLVATATSTATFQILAALHVNPITGYEGTQAVLAGAGLATANGVLFGTVAATTYSVDSDTQITVTVPVGAPSGAITVRRPDGVLQSAETFTVRHDLTFASFSPNTGGTGTRVTIKGGGFTGANQVLFGTTQAVYTVDTDTQITATVPAGLPTGACNIYVYVGGSYFWRSPFTVLGTPAITGFTPASGPVGTVVTLTGTSLATPTAVRFNGTLATTFTGLSATQVQATVPAGTTTGTLSVTTAAGTGTSTASFTVTGGSLAISTPPQSLTVMAGGAAAFTVAASGGVSPYHYQWKKGTTNVGTDTPGFSLSAAAASDAGSYTVALTDSSSPVQTVTSAAATLTVTAVLTLPTQPQNLSASPGSAASFTVVAAGGTAPFHYQWKKAGVNVGTDSATLALASIQASDAGSYAVVVTDSSSPVQTVTSTSATLTVGAALAVFMQPASLSAPVGGTATFLVAGTGGTLPYHYQWKKGGVNLGMDSATLSLTNVQASDTGSYTVVITDSSLPIQSLTSKAATLTVNGVLALSLQPASVTVMAGTTATFTTAAGGGVAPYHYQWKKAGVNVGTDAATLSLTSLQASDAGSYTVVVTDSSNPVQTATSTAATLTVTSVLALTTQPASVTVATGAPAAFTVTAAGGTAPYHYQWKKAGSNIGSDAGIFGFTSAQASDAGSFTVVVTDSSSPVQSVTSSAATLTVTTALALTTQPASVSVTAGAAATFTVAAAGGTTPYHYQWKKAGATVGTDAATLGLTSAQPSDAGSYTVVVTDSSSPVQNVTSAPATLTVNAALAITTQPASVTVTVATSAALTIAAAGGTAPYHYQWKKAGVNVGTDAATLSFPSAQVSDAGSYSVLVTDSSSPVRSLASSAATLTVNPVLVLATQPGSVSVAVNGTATFTTAASGGLAPYHYQWKKAGTSVGTDAPTLALASVQAADAGSYTVVVTDSATPAQTVTSNPALLTILQVVQLSLTPRTTVLPVGAQQSFTATLLNTTNPNVTWTISGPGTLSAVTGTTVTVLTGATAGTITLTATSVADPTVTATAVLTSRSLDLNGDQAVDVLDLAVLAARYGKSGPGADLNGDNIVDDADVLLWLSRF